MNRNRTPSIRYPRYSPFSILHQWIADMFDGDRTAAKLFNFFYHWHESKLDSAENLGHEVDYDPLLQHHTEAELESGLIVDASRKKIRAALQKLYDIGVLTREQNPHNAHDRTAYFLFHPEAVEDFADLWDEISREQRSLYGHKGKVCVPGSLVWEEVEMRRKARKQNGLMHQSKWTHGKVCLDSSMSPPDLHSKILSKNTYSNKETPLYPPEGGNAPVLSEISNSGTAGNEQTPPFDQQAKQSDKADRGEGVPPRRRAKSKKSGKSKTKKARQTSEEILGAVPEPMRDRFDKFWRGYSTYCTQRRARIGSKKNAALAWVDQVSTNFSGLGVDGFDQGVKAFLKFQGDNTAGIPHACRFILARDTGEGKWQDALEQAKARGTPSDLTPVASDRGNAPPIVVAADQPEFKSSPPPPHVKAQLDEFRRKRELREQAQKSIRGNPQC